MEAVMRPNRYRLIEEGYTWEEAENKLADYAEEQADAERDRQAEEFFKTKEKANEEDL
jgi:uncharacterized protein involved in exopolysaccharide biosynthesis